MTDGLGCELHHFQIHQLEFFPLTAPQEQAKLLNEPIRGFNDHQAFLLLIPATSSAPTPA